MNEIRCPKCGNVITIDSATYANVIKQVRDLEFQKELSSKIQELEKRKAIEIQAAKDKTKIEMLSQINKTDSEYKKLQAVHQGAINTATKAVMERDAKIVELTTRLNSMVSEQKAAIDKAIALERNANTSKDVEIARLRAELDAKDRESASKQENIILSTKAKINELKAENESMRASNAAEQANMREKYNALLQAKEDEIARMKEFRSKLNVKQIGESLETHCMAQYTTIQSALPNATFQKDTALSDAGTKGDYIFRETDDNGYPLVSIMFEMKNEADESVNKHKNEDFFKKLDKDRTAKECEYAVLVTTLEPESEIYNQGIVAVNQYPKMFVIRPQFFLSFLLLLRSLSTDKTDLRKTIAELKARNIDASNLESDLMIFKDAILKCHAAATGCKDKAIVKIDKIIQMLQDIREDLTKMDNHMATAEKKAEKLTINKLQKQYSSALSHMMDNSLNERSEEAAGSNDSTAA